MSVADICSGWSDDWSCFSGLHDYEDVEEVQWVLYELAQKVFTKGFFLGLRCVEEKEGHFSCKKLYKIKQWGDEKTLQLFIEKMQVGDKCEGLIDDVVKLRLSREWFSLESMTLRMRLCAVQAALIDCAAPVECENLSMSQWQDKIVKKVISLCKGHVKSAKVVSAIWERVEASQLIKFVNEACRGVFSAIEASDREIPPLAEKMREFSLLFKRHQLIVSTKLPFVPKEIEFFSCVTELGFHGCGIIKLPDTIGCLSLLEKCILSENRLDRLPDSFRNLKKLRLLDICENTFAQCPGCFADLPALEEVRIHRNPMNNCSVEVLSSKNSLQKLWIDTELFEHCILQGSSFSHLKTLAISGHFSSDLPLILDFVQNFMSSKVSKSVYPSAVEENAQLFSAEDLSMKTLQKAIELSKLSKDAAGQLDYGAILQSLKMSPIDE